MPAERGYGWARFDFGDRIGPNDRYTIMHKLGWGMHSSTWLARDSVENNFVTIKAFTGYITSLIPTGQCWELDALYLVSAPPQSPYCQRYITEFTIPRRVVTDGDHLCIVTPVYSDDIKALVCALCQEKPRAFSLRLVQHIILHILHGLTHMHSCKVIHTDLKHDNIFFTTEMGTEDIERWIAEDPPRHHNPERSQSTIICTAVSQPLPMISMEEALHATYLLGDFRTAVHSKLHPNHVLTIPPLRPPEVFLGAEWDKSADIWSFECLAYELINGRALFRYQINKKFNLTETENMLYQMMCFTGEPFRVKQLNASPLTADYFNEECMRELKLEPEIMDLCFEAQMRVWKVVPEDLIDDTGTFLRRCLHLDPDKRATAEELLSDSWLVDTE
ncbi:kinase-like protein [Laetiporus sulphureus 93-53]|uniref:Kinase-like protein n=1 Tax=Laetiporus sulphureus 93-53 TaxID=1314785 RepID=A0A165DK36_9APHY|nr:kinase-like protein [Laetiporus sulphureus 93-53]KZT05058.1 kinase-like protein [Laetiporus sulphureus 93-53]